MIYDIETNFSENQKITYNKLYNKQDYVKIDEDKDLI